MVDIRTCLLVRTTPSGAPIELVISGVMDALPTTASNFPPLSN